MDARGVALSELAKLDRGAFGPAVAAYLDGGLPEGIKGDDFGSSLWRAEVALYLGRLDEAAIEIASLTSNGFGADGDLVHRMLLLEGELSHLLGDADAAEGRYHQALEQCRATGDRQNEARALLDVSRLARRRGQWGDALSTLSAARERCSEGSYLDGVCSYNEGCARYDLADSDGCQRAFKRAKLILDSVEGLKMAGLVRVGESYLLMGYGDLAAADAGLALAEEAIIPLISEQDTHAVHSAQLWVRLCRGEYGSIPRPARDLARLDRSSANAFAELYALQLVSIAEAGLDNVDAAAEAARDYLDLARVAGAPLDVFEGELLVERAMARLGDREAVGRLLVLVERAEKLEQRWYEALARVYVADAWRSFDALAFERALALAEDRASRTANAWVYAELAAVRRWVDVTPIRAGSSGMVLDWHKVFPRWADVEPAVKNALFGSAYERAGRKVQTARQWLGVGTTTLRAGLVRFDAFKPKRTGRPRSEERGDKGEE